MGRGELAADEGGAVRKELGDRLLADGGAQLAFGNAWRELISAEMLIGFGPGLGRSLAYSGEIADMVGVMMNILVIASLATMIDQVVLEKFKQRMLRYQYV